jgi:tetratricopeptide (TPR) repeat protein
MNHPAIAYLVRGHYKTIVALCQQEIITNPQDWLSYWYLGLAYLLQDQEAEAQDAWLGATLMLNETADSIAVAAELGKFLLILVQEADRQLQLGQAQVAERLAWQALELDETRSHTHWLLAHAVSLQGRLEEAIEHWQTAIDLQLERPYCIDAYVQQGEIWQKLAQWDAAIVAYCQALKLEPTGKLRYTIHYNLGLCLAQQQQWQAASEQFDQAIQLQPNDSTTYGDRGWVRLQLNQKQAAAADFQIALSQRSAFAEMYCAWVQTLKPSAQSPLVIRNANWLSQFLPDFGKFRKQESHLYTNPSHPQTVQSDETGAEPPIGCYASTREWAMTAASTTFVPLDPSQVIQLKLPKAIDRSVHFSFRFGSVFLPETFVVQIPKGRVWLNAEQTSSAILTEDNYLLGDLSPEFPLLSPGHPDKHSAQHSIFCKHSLSAAQSINGTVAVLAGLTNEIYFHWIVDILPRLDLLRRSGFNLADIDYFLVSDRLPFQRETLQLLDIPASKIITVTTPLHLKADRLIVPSYPSSPAWVAPWVCQWLRQIFLDKTLMCDRSGDRVYITRQHTKNRRIINESAVIEFLQTLGFESVALETLSVQEQAALFARAAVIVAPHGGGLTNTVFCQPGTKIIELFSPNYIYPCYWFISNHLNLDYYYLTGGLPAGFFLHRFLYPDERTEDFAIELEDLKAVLALAGVGKC